MSEGERQTDRKRRGFVVRYELMGIIGLLILQLFGAIWWASTMSAAVVHMSKNLERLTVIVEKAANDNAVKFDKVNDVLLRHESRITRLEPRS